MSQYPQQIGIVDENDNLVYETHNEKEALDKLEYYQKNNQHHYKIVKYTGDYYTGFK